MAARTASQAWIWALAAAVLAALLWAMGDIILPFVIGAGLAYFLNPLVEQLVRRGLHRGLAVALIFGLAALAVVIAVVVLVPVLISQGRALAEAAPGLFEALSNVLGRAFPELSLDRSGVQQMLAQAGEWARAQAGEVVNRVVSSARSLLGVVLMLVIVPVVTIYLLLDWPRMIAAIDRLLPRPQAPRIRQIAHEMDRSISAYVRGMGTVCLLMAAYYGIGLMLVGLQFGLVLGAITGILTFIPYVGALIGGALTVGFALYQFWGDWLGIGLVVAVFAAGQFVEGNIITPRILGQAIGIHPVWLLLALSAFAAMFGLVGMLIAVPLAAAAGVLVRHATGAYMDSDLYRGPRSPLLPPSGPADTP